MECLWHRCTYNGCYYTSSKQPIIKYQTPLSSFCSIPGHGLHGQGDNNLQSFSRPALFPQLFPSAVGHWQMRQHWQACANLGSEAPSWVSLPQNGPWGNPSHSPALNVSSVGSWLVAGCEAGLVMSAWKRIEAYWFETRRFWVSVDSNYVVHLIGMWKGFQDPSDPPFPNLHTHKKRHLLIRLPKLP